MNLDGTIRKIQALFKVKDTLSYQIKQLLKLNDIIIDFEELSFQIQSHPSYPSLHAVTGVLDHFNIENLALDVPIDISTLEQLPNTFLAQVSTDGTKNFVVVTKKNNKFQLLHSKSHKVLCHKVDFLDQFTGIVLAVIKNESTLAEEKPKTNDLLKKTCLLVGFSLVILTFSLSNVSLVDYILFGLSLLGLYITYNIFKQEEGEASTLGNAFCDSITATRNCNAVLSSNGATPFKDFKLSDLSFVYFTGLSLSIYLLVLNNASLFLPKLITLFALPITIYSIYYQGIVLKQWCTLCLFAVAILWAQIITAVIVFEPIFEIKNISITTLSFLLIAVYWLYESKVLKSNRQLKFEQIDYYKFKRNFELFNTQLKSSPVLNTPIKSNKEMVFGHATSALNITIITNPLCGHCKPVHKLIEKLLDRYHESINITVRFNVNTKVLSNDAAQIALRLLELYDTKSSQTCLEAMHDIYGDMPIEIWLNKWSSCVRQDIYLEVLKNEKHWCSEKGINFTPEILINGQSYPKMFDRSDLIYFIDDLIEQAEMTPLESSSKVVLSK